MSKLLQDMLESGGALKNLPNKMMKIAMMKEVELCLGHQDYSVGELNT